MRITVIPLPDYEMSVEFAKRLEEQVNCAICLDTYTDPRLLQCFHVYCTRCLIKLAVKDGQGRLSLTCPTCRHITLLPANGVSDLQSAFHINQLLEMWTDLKKVKLPQEKVQLAAMPPPLPTPRKTALNCSEHNGEELKLFCETCEELVCFHCTLRTHHSHKYKLVSEVLEKHKEEMKTGAVRPLQEHLVLVDTALGEIEVCSREIVERQAVTEACIDDAFGQLRELLHVRQTELVSQLHQMNQWKLKGLAAQRDQMETSRIRIGSCLDFIQKNLEAGNGGELLRMKPTIMKQVVELLQWMSTAQDSLPKHTTASAVVFSPSLDVNLACQKYGDVYDSGLPDPSQCIATGDGIQSAVVEENTVVILDIINSKGSECEVPVTSLECDFCSEITGTAQGCSIEKVGQSQYEIGYQPVIKGRHQLCIRVNKRQIRGSPFTVNVTLPVEKLSTSFYKMVSSALQAPHSVVLDQSGQLIVTDTMKHCVTTFLPSGEKILSFGTLGSGEGEFDHPLGVTVNKEGDLLVADSMNHRIQKLTSKGQFLATVGTKGNGCLQFQVPCGVAFNVTNDKLYVVGRDCRIQILNSDLTFYKAFGSRGSGCDKFSSPTGLACCKNGFVYVADTGNDRIQVFTAECQLLRSFQSRDVPGSVVVSRDNLFLPRSLAVDTVGHIYVSEDHWNRVSIFTSEGHYILSLQVGGASGIVVGGGVVYVCDTVNNCIQLF